MALRTGARVRSQGRRRGGDGGDDPLIRGWCGQDASEEFDQVLTLREEVDRLRTLVQEIAGWLNHNGHPVKAGLLRKELGKIPETDEDRP
jgi:hypothetical protein